MWTRRNLCKVLVLGAAWSLSGTQPMASPIDGFLELSARLCGVPRNWLSPSVGEIYLQELRDWGVDWTRLEHKANSGYAQALVRWWYSGCCESDAGDRRVCWEEALIWRLNDWSPPPTVCNTPGAWSGPASG